MKIFNLSPAGPLSISWDLTSRCNFNCRHCFNRSGVFTINDIINELLNLKEVTKENVISILDKMYICRMLKSEDRDLYPKRHRSTDVNEVLEGPYKEHNITVIKGYFK